MIPTSTLATVVVKNRAPATTQAAVVFITQGETSAPRSADLLSTQASQSIARLLKSGAAKGKANQVTFDLRDDAKSFKRVYSVGLGKPDKITTETLRQAAGALARALTKHRLPLAAIALPEIVSLQPHAIAHAIATGLLLASFDYREYKGTASKKSDADGEPSKPLNITLAAPSQTIRQAEQGAVSASIICQGQNFARTIASRPGNDINPPTLAAVSKQMAREAGLGCTVFDDKQLRKLKMGGILAVGDGSIHAPPRMIVLEYKPTSARKSKSSAKPLLIVGKAITFDTGGISIKPADKMGKMIFDKCGGMAVLGLMLALAKLKLPIHVVGILSSAENAISSKAYRPGDILRMYNGVTVEVTNTDAEGRLVLGDAIAWGIEKYQPAAVVDLATLTGGVIVALGKTMAGVMSNDDDLVKQLTDAGKEAGEEIWRLPLGDAQREFIKSDCADIVNSAGREGHPLQGGAFLSYFVPADKSIPWAHLDIAGVADTEKELPYYARGATGWGVRTLVNWITSRST